ncbi:MAG: hypothetical protein LBB54_04605 [Cellulomonadaceae bacterium]|jgi:hypothetical protein|nr:hypothetical protein [Cellulomonadaceae bacterium]
MAGFVEPARPATPWPGLTAAVVHYLDAPDRLSPAFRDDVHVGDVKLTASALADLDHTCQVIVRDDGGEPLDDVRSTARLGVNVWAPSENIADRLAAAVRRALDAMTGGRPVLACTASRPIPIDGEVEPLRYLTADLIIFTNSPHL